MLSKSQCHEARPGGRILVRAAGVALVAVLLAGCGQRGPLVPLRRPPEPPTAPSAGTPPEMPRPAARPAP